MKIEDSKQVIESKINQVKIKSGLKSFYYQSSSIIEIGADEAGRGPLFGRVYASAVILPKDKDNNFDYSQLKDSKKFHSHKKIVEVANYIKENAVAWAVCFRDENVIDDINILQATQEAIHEAIQIVHEKYSKLYVKSGVIEQKDFCLLIDGNYFKPKPLPSLNNNNNNNNNNINHNNESFDVPLYHTIEGGDNLYCSIAAASILAKVDRDQYIQDMCSQNPYLSEKYGLDKHKGYGTKKHLDAIREYGITPWHRKTFGICKKYIS
jgi:ribonuclease HII